MRPAIEIVRTVGALDASVGRVWSAGDAHRFRLRAKRTLERKRSEVCRTQCVATRAVQNLLRLCAIIHPPRYPYPSVGRVRAALVLARSDRSARARDVRGGSADVRPGRPERHARTVIPPAMTAPRSPSQVSIERQRIRSPRSEFLFIPISPFQQGRTDSDMLQPIEARGPALGRNELLSGEDGHRGGRQRLPPLSPEWSGFDP